MKPLVIVAGPTACGKSAAAVDLAERIDGEVISADSVQVYRGMDIGSAKLSKEEMRGIRHHLINVLDPTEAFNVAIFQRMAKEALCGIYARSHVPVLCGGTGFYIQALLYDIAFSEEETDSSYRRKLTAYSSEELYAMLMEVDPVSCELIHLKNKKRLIRALEFYHDNGRPISEHNAKQRSKEAAYDAHFFVLCDERAAMYARIDARVDAMMRAGLLDEVRRLWDSGLPRNATAMQAIGYKELYAHLFGECSLEEAVERIKQNSRHFAKRQLTYFRRESSAIWLDRSKYAKEGETIADIMLQML